MSICTVIFSVIYIIMVARTNCWNMFYSILFLIYPFIFFHLQASSYGLSDNSFRFGSLTVMPNARLDFYKPVSLAQSLKLNISDKFHIFPGGMVSSQSINVHARNITVEVAGSIETKSSGFTVGSGKGMSTYKCFHALHLG